MDYYSASREDMFNILPQPPCKVLELGCGKGNFGALLKKEFDCFVTGVELFEDAAMEARSKIDEVFQANIDEFDFSLLTSDYDLIVANDVLEHLRDPWKTINRLHNHLLPGGYFIASIPNMRYRRVFMDLLFRGDWQYTDSGILDRTHLHFFTLKTIPGLFQGYKTIKVLPINDEPVFPRYFVKYVWKSLIPDMFVLQYAVIAQK